MKATNEILSETVAEELLMEWVFEAPRELVWQAFTQPEHLQHWWGPKSFKLKVARLDLRPGGEFLYSMTSAAGHVMWGKIVYHEIQAPERIVFVNSFADEAGNIIRAPFSETWPLEMYNSWTFTEQAGKTTLTLRGRSQNATEAEQETYTQGPASMQQGFGGTFDQLTDYLTKISDKSIITNQQTKKMATKIFVNLPVKDLNKSITFFTQLGYTFNPQFTDEKATCMIIGEDIFVMLLVEEFFKTFTKKEIADASKSTETIICLSADSREQVDELVEKAFAAGAAESNFTMDQGFMYGRSFQDLDGHLWEVMYMDPSALQQG